MKMMLRTLMASLVVASAMGCATGGVGDEWFVLGEQTLDSASPSVEITSSGGRWEKDVKQVRLSADGADVQITNLALHWDNRPDDTLTDVGVLKSGGQAAPMNAPGMKARLKSVTVHYQIMGGASSANLKVWGYD